MMQDKALINGLRKLKQIKPNHNWVVLNKSQILGQDAERSYSFSLLSNFSFFPYLKPAFASLMALLIVYGAYGFTKNSLPGDALYAVKKVYQKAQSVFVSGEDMTGYQLGLANARLEDLVKAPAKNLAPTINEFQASISQATKNLTEMSATTSSSAAIKKIAQEAKKLDENRQKIESLGVVIGDQGSAEFDSAMSKIVENIIKDMESRTLSEDKTKILDQMKTLFTEKNYSGALELYLLNQ